MYELEEHKSDEATNISNKPLLFKIGLISILRDVINNLSMMEIIIKPPFAEEDYKLPETLEEKLDDYNNDETVLKYSGDNYDSMLNRFKLKKKIEKLEDIMKKLLIALIKYDNFQSIKEELKNRDDMEHDEKKLLKDHKEFKEKVKEFKEIILKERRIGLMEIQKLTDTIGTLKDNFEDLICDSNYKTKYIKNWEKARLEQFEYRNKLVLQEYENEIEITRNTLQNEYEIFESVVHFYNLKIIETGKLIEQWHEKYENDLKIANAENDCLKSKLHEQKELIRAKNNLYIERKEKIEAYLTYKERKRLEQECLNMLNQAATKIQAWWRGIMVRQGLGPYRKRRGKGKKDNGKKGKKKSK